MMEMNLQFFGGRGSSGGKRSGGGGGSSSSAYSGPKQMQASGKTFHVVMQDGEPTISISMYDLQRRITAVRRFAKENGVRVVYTK